MDQHARLRRAEAAVAIKDFDAAIADYRLLAAGQPGNARYLVGLAMAYIGKRDIGAARSILDPLIDKQPSGPAYFARSLAWYFSGDPVASRKDLDRALLAEPSNPQYRGLQRRLDDEQEAAKAKATKK